MPYILALDQGTTSSRAIVFDHDGAIRAVAQKEFRQIFPQPAGSSTTRTRSGRRRSASPSRRSDEPRCAAKDIAAIGITNQRETTVVWDRETGEPIYNAIVWQDRRTADFCERLKAQGGRRDDSGQDRPAHRRLFLGSKIRWILDNVPGAKARADAGELAFGTVDSWLVWKLTGDARTSPTSATPRARCCSTSTRCSGTTSC